jgi:DNA polymerase/3'-5' exonuclease PolX
VARSLALEVVELLRPATTRLEIAGSVRRHVPLVGDLELLAAPRVEPVVDLLGERPASERNLLDDRVQELLDAGVLGVRHALGSRYKALWFKGEAVDLFAVLPPASWGVLKLIRTGPADFSRRFVTPRSQGGWLPPPLTCYGGALWMGDHQQYGVPILETPEELDVFGAAGLAWLPPAERTATVRARFGKDGAFVDWRDRGPVRA